MTGGGVSSYDLRRRALEALNGLIEAREARRPVNAYMNISVRVHAKAAQAEVQLLRKRVAELEAQLARAGRGGAAAGMFGSGAKSAAAFGSQLQWTGRQLSYNFTLPLLLAGGAATKFALDNERAMIRVKKVYGDATHTAAFYHEELDALGRAFTQLSAKYGVNQAQTIEIAGSWAAAGASGLALAKAVKLTMETMILGEIDAAKATESLIAIQAQYGLTVDQLAQSIDTLNVIENETGISMQGLIDGFGRAAGVARSAGVDIQHLGAMLAALVPAAGTAQNAGNALKTIISRLLSPTGSAADVLGLMGVHLEDIEWKSKNASQRLELLATRFEKLDDAQKAVVSSEVASRWQINRFDVLMRDIALSLNEGTREMSYYGRALDATASAQDNFNVRVAELNTVLESNPQRLQQIWVILQNAMADIIVPMIPTIVYLGQMVAGLARSFADLPPAWQKLALAGVLLLASFGILLRYLGSTITLVAEVGNLARIVLGPLGSMARGAATAAGVLISQLAAALGTVIGMLFSLIVASAKSVTYLWRLPAIISLIPAAVTIFVADAIIALKLFVRAVPGILATAGTIFSTFAAQIRFVWGVGLYTALAAYKYVQAGIAALYGSVMVGLMRVNAAVQLFFFTTLPGTIIKSVGAVAAATRIVMATIVGTLAWLSTSSVPVIFSAMNSITFAAQSALIAGGRAITAVWAATMAALPRIQAAILMALPRIQATINAAMWSAWAAMHYGLIAIQATMSKVLLINWRKFGGALRTIWLTLTTNMTAIWAAFWASLTLPIALFAGAAVALLIIFWDDIRAGFEVVAAGITRAFYALPANIQSALIAVVRVIRDAALQVYEWFSYLNPFAHHSPSLVEQVQRGMAAIRSEYAKAGNVGAIFARAARNLKAFKDMADALGGGEWSKERIDIAEGLPQALGLFDALMGDLGSLNTLLNALESAVADQEEVVGRWEDALDAANDKIDIEQRALDGLEAQLRSLQDAYQAHEDALNDYARAPIEGMGAMEDQIFANEMAQKRLRLEIAKLNQAGEGVDDLRNRLASLQGDIETLRGNAADLRASGAGSDVLGPINAEIAAMETQYKAMEKAVSDSPVSNLQKQLEDLQNQGEILDLEKSLQFDPLKRQIDELANGLKELPFDVILDGINTERAAMNELQPQIDAASQAVDRQTAAVDALKLARDAVQASYDDEKDKLDEIKDAYSAVQDSIRDIESALHDMGSSASTELSKMRDAANAAKEAAGPKHSPGGLNFLAAEGGNFPDVGGAAHIGREGGVEDQAALIDQWIKDQVGDIGDMFGSFDMFEPIKKWWNKTWSWVKDNLGPVWTEVVNGFSGLNLDAATKPFTGFVSTLTEWGQKLWDLFGPQFREIWTALSEAFAPAWKEISDALEKFKEIPFFEALKNGWALIKPLLGIIAGAVILAFSVIFNVLGNIIGPIIDMIAGVLSGLIGIIRGIVNIIVGIFTGDFGRIKDGVLQIIGGLIEGVWAILKGGAQIIWGVVSGLVEGIVDFFKWLWDVLVGHSIVPDMVDAIIKFFTNLWKKGVELVKNLVDGVVGFFTNLYNNGTKIISDLWTWVVNKFQEKTKAVIDTVFDLYQKARGYFENIRDKLSEIAGAAKDLVTGKFNDLRDAILGAFGYVKDKISGIFNDINTFIKSGINTGIKAVNKLIDGLNKVADILPGLDWHIGAVPLLAAGGNVPSRRVGNGFVTSGARAIVGEGKANHPEFVIPTDPTYRTRAQALYAALGNRLGMPVPQYALGGILGSIKSAAGDAGNWFKNSADYAAEWVKNATKGAASTLMRPFKDAAQNAIDSMNWDFGRKAASALLNSVTSWTGEADKVYKEGAEQGGGRGDIKGFIHAADALPYIWGGVGPGGYDCSGLTGEVLNRMQGGASYRRRFVTASNFASLGWKSGRGGVYTIGVDRAGGHMAGEYGGLPFEAASTRSGIKVGAAARKVGTFPQMYHMAQGGLIETMIQLGRRLDIAGDPSVTSVDGKAIAMAAGGVARARRGGTLMRVGEAGQDEAVMPLPDGWERIFDIVRNVDPDILKSDARLASRVGDRVSSAQSRGVTINTSHTENNEYHFHGDLSFPNISDPADAEEFLRNLETLAGA